MYSQTLIHERGGVRSNLVRISRLGLKTLGQCHEGFGTRSALPRGPGFRSWSQFPAPTQQLTSVTPVPKHPIPFPGFHRYHAYISVHLYIHVSKMLIHKVKTNLWQTIVLKINSPTGSEVKGKTWASQDSSRLRTSDLVSLETCFQTCHVCVGKRMIRRLQFSATQATFPVFKCKSFHGGHCRQSSQSVTESRIIILFMLLGFLLASLQN